MENSVELNLQQQASEMPRKVKKISKEVHIAEFYIQNEERFKTLEKEGKLRDVLGEVADLIIEGEKRGIFRKRSTASSKSRQKYIDEVHWYLRQAAKHNLCSFTFKQRKKKAKTESNSAVQQVESNVINTQDSTAPISS